ncbi:MAG: hypothetical protein ACXWCY_22205 [Burkholderiales bacterium]
MDVPRQLCAAAERRLPKRCFDLGRRLRHFERARYITISPIGISVRVLRACSFYCPVSAVGPIIFGIDLAMLLDCPSSSDAAHTTSFIPSRAPLTSIASSVSRKIAAWAGGLDFGA